MHRFWNQPVVVMLTVLVMVVLEGVVLVSVVVVIIFTIRSAAKLKHNSSQRVKKDSARTLGQSTLDTGNRHWMLDDTLEHWTLHTRC